jgi:hypothetical protein
MSLRILSSKKFSAVLDLEKEDRRVMERCPSRISMPETWETMESLRAAQKFLRRGTHH